MLPVGARVIYNPNMPLAEPMSRKNHHGVILSIQGNNYVVDLYNMKFTGEFAARCIAPLMEEIAVPAGTCDAIMEETIMDNMILVDFLRTGTRYESEFGNFYTETTFNALILHPFTRKPIEGARRLVARVV